jgi:hypothetical protein
MTNQPILSQSLAKQSHQFETRVLEDFLLRKSNASPAEVQCGMEFLQFASRLKRLQESPNVLIHIRMTYDNHQFGMVG